MKKIQLIATFVLIIAIATTLSGISPVQGLRAGDPKLVVKLPSSALATTGATVNAGVSMKVVAGSLYNSFDIVVKADPLVLNPTKISLGSAVSTVNPVVTTFCINGVGINCGTNDGPGIAHLAAHFLANANNGTLFKVAYKAINGVGAFGSIGTTLTIPCFSFGENGIPYSPTKYQVSSFTYGTVPAAAQPTATVTANQTSIAIKSGSTHSVTITVKGLNGFSSAVTVTASSFGLLKATFGTSAISTIATCDCGAQSALQLAITPSAAGSFFVTIASKSPGTTIPSLTIQVTGI